jgi:predicted acetyltransferase
MTESEMRPITAEEFPEYFRRLVETFHEEVRDTDREMDLAVFEPARSLAVFDRKEIVGTTAIFSRGMTVPGGQLPAAAVTFVSVAPTHRRRGLLTAMMRRQLTELYEGGTEAVAALWASEAPIYQRFGYGSATAGARLTGRTRALGFRREADLGAGRVRLVGEEEARPRLAEVYEQVRVGTPGFLDRRDRWWDYRLYDPEHHRGGASASRYALHEEPGGQVTGYALYRTKSKWSESGPDGELTVWEIMASTPQAYAALWSYLLNIDLIRSVSRSHGPIDEPLQHLVLDPRAVQLTPTDQLWVRLADVGRALAARRYAAELDVVLEISDGFCPWNAGRWRLSAGPAGSRCERSTDPADLALSSTELGAAYLGGTALASLAAAGRVRELRPGALAAASAAFLAARPPWCPEVF